MRNRSLRGVAFAAGWLLSLALVPAVAHAGVVAGASPTFPTFVTVGSTGLAATIDVRNDNTPPDQATTNTVCNSGDPFPCPPGDPGITLIASCGQLGAFSACTPAGADPGVFQLSATAQGQFGTACASQNFNVALIDPTFGQVRFTPQPAGTHVMLPGAGTLCRIGFTFDVVRSPNVDQNPVQAGRQTVQIVDNTQHTGGITAAARGTSAGTTVLAAQPTIATTASAPVVLGAGTLTDTATVSGLVNPVTSGPGVGTVEFRLYGPGDATCATAIFTSSSRAITFGAGNTEGAASSASFTPTSAGTYRWRAFFSGDANNDPVSGACNAPGESTIVNPALAAIATTASAAITLGAGALTDSATVSGLVNPVTTGPGVGTVEFRLYGPGDATCATAIFTSSSRAITFGAANTAGTASSASFTPTSAGTYRWRAFFSGDANNAPVSGACNAPGESTIVSPALAAIATTASLPIALGAGALTDSATVSGLVNPVTTGPGVGTVEFRLYGPGDATCATVIFTSSGRAITFGAANTAGTASSASFTPTTTGVYRWRAFYSGDANNAPVSGACNAPGESTIVNPAQPVIATTASAAIRLGGQVTDTATVSGRVSALAGATVEFRLYGPTDTSCTAAPVFTSAAVAYPVADGPVTSTAFTPTATGVYRWRAFYSGDANNAAVSGACGDAGESVTVTAATPPPPPPPTPTCGGRKATIVVKAGQRSVLGTAGNDVIVGTDAGESINARGGNDKVCAGKGNDVVQGGTGSDALVGENGDDRLKGGSGNDTLAGGRGRDKVDGGAGRDRIDEKGLGGFGRDDIKGGLGDDTIKTAGGESDRVDCGPGRDRVEADRRDRLRRCEIVKRVKPPANA